MQRFNIYQFYQLGNALRALTGITAEHTLRQTWWDLFTASGQVKQLVSSPSLRLAYCRPAAEELLTAINSALPLLDQKEEKEINWDVPLGPTLSYRITNALRIFEHNLSIELQKHDAYLISQKGIYSTGELIEHAENLFPESIRKQIPGEVVADIRQAGRCLAFDLPTAAMFHILRATKTMIEKLKDGGGDPKVVAAIDQMRELHQNPTLHPGVFLDLDDALALLGVAQSVILRIVADIQKRRPSA